MAPVSIRNSVAWMRISAPLPDPSAGQAHSMIATAVTASTVSSVSRLGSRRIAIARKNSIR